MRSKALTALPAFIATYGGVTLYLAGKDRQWIRIILVLVGFFVVGFAGLFVGRALIRNRPVAGTWLMSAWIFALIAVGACLTALFLFVGLNLPGWITEGEITDEAKEVTKVLLGAATAFAAVVFTDDLDKAEGVLWPSTKTKEALTAAFEPKNFTGGTREYEAAFEERVAPATPTDTAITGWGFVPRIRRARILKDHV